MEKKWNKTNLGVILLLIVFWPAGLFFMWKYTNWKPKIKWGITAVFAFLFLLGSIVIATSKPVSVSSQQEAISASDITAQPTSFAPTNTPKPTMQTTKAPTITPKPTIKPTAVSKKITEKINNLVSEKYPNFEVTIWNKNSDFASEGQIPYEVVLNGSFNKTVATSCDGAKKLSYYILETFYKDSEIRPTLSRIMITIPYYLRVSLGASDGVPMEKNGSFSGPTNFWNVMENMGLGENESGEMKNRTWGNYLTKCE